MTRCLKTRIAAAVLLLFCGAEGAAAGPMPVQAASQFNVSAVVAAQYYGSGYPLYGYRRPYGYYRPYGLYRPYGYGPGPRYYANHFGPGAAKERYRTRLDFCKNQPQRC